VMACAASASAIIGHPLPPATAVTQNLKASPQTFGASAVAT
jgi:hypothetical protein